MLESRLRPIWTQTHTSHRFRRCPTYPRLYGGMSISARESPCSGKCLLPERRFTLESQGWRPRVRDTCKKYDSSKGLLPGRSCQQTSCFCIMVWFPTFRSPDSLVVSTLGTRSSATGNPSSINGVTPVLRMSLWLEIQVASAAQLIHY